MAAREARLQEAERRELLGERIDVLGGDVTPEHEPLEDEEDRGGDEERPGRRGRSPGSASPRCDRFARLGAVTPHGRGSESHGAVMLQE